MNINRLVISIIVVFIAVFATDFLIHGLWLSSLYGSTNELWRPEAEMSSGKYMGWMIGGQLLAAITFTTLWAVGFAQHGKLSCAVLFGLFMALFSQTHTLISYAVQPLPMELVWKWLFSGVVQGIVLGIIVSFVYKPKASSF
jgi:hypothetical protein